tara:strand:+ start:131 stop:376 length:246 start_codon:yes stop_codon:yes gene_type:complete
MLVAVVLVVIPLVSKVVLVVVEEVMEDLHIQLQQVDMEKQVAPTLVVVEVVDQELHQAAMAVMVDLVLLLSDIKYKYLKKL